MLSEYSWWYSTCNAVADRRGGCEGSKFFQFHAVFGKIWQNRMLAPPLPRGVGAPSSGKSWIRHWNGSIYQRNMYPYRWKSGFCWIVQSKTMATAPVDSVECRSERRWPFLRVIFLWSIQSVLWTLVVLLVEIPDRTLSFITRLNDCFHTFISRKLNTKVSKFFILAEDISEPISDLEIVEER